LSLRHAHGGKCSALRILRDRQQVDAAPGQVEAFEGKWKVGLALEGKREVVDDVEAVADELGEIDLACGLIERADQRTRVQGAVPRR